MIEELKNVFTNRNQVARKLADQGKKVVGWMCTYVPEEIIYAAGAHPIRVVGAEGTTTTADAHLYSNVCTYARASLEEGFRGSYDFLSGYIAVNTCDNIRRLYEVWSRYLNTPFTHILKLPHRADEEAVEYFAGELNDFREKLGAYVGKDISDDALWQAIEVYNHSRALLRELYELRKADSPPITGAEVMDVFLAGIIMPKDEYNRKLKTLLNSLKGHKTVNGDRIRILVMGSELDNSEYIRTIEELGGIVVCDDLCNGTRYFWDPVEVSGDPIQALANRYMRRSPCARMRPNTERMNHVRRLIQDYRIDGIVYEALKFCDLYGEDYPIFKENIKDMEVPSLLLTRDYFTAGMGQMKTRIQAFFETLQE